MPVERRYRVTGVVQGVGFRWWTRSAARRIGVTGTVRNLPDGSVEVRARGERALLEQLRAELREGPPVSRVESVEEEADEGVPGDSFDIAP